MRVWYLSHMHKASLKAHFDVSSGTEDLNFSLDQLSVFELYIERRCAGSPESWLLADAKSTKYQNLICWLKIGLNTIDYRYIGAKGTIFCTSSQEYIVLGDCL